MALFASSKPILTYFDLYGRGEAIRMALTHGKIDFEDSRVTGESWKAFKTSGKCANGQVPVLEVGDKAMNQSEAILRFVGKQTGAYDTSDPFAAWAADAIIATCADFEKSQPKSEAGKPLFYAMFGPEPMPEEAVKEMVAHRTTWMEALAALLPADQPFFGGAKPSIADFWVCAMVYSWERNTQGKEMQKHVYGAYAEALAANAPMTAWADRMGAELKDYIAARRPGTV